MGQLPAYLHYAKDWLTDTNLRLCSKAAKGVWQDCLDIMFLNSVRGVASFGDGTPWTDEELCRAIGGDVGENMNCIQELLVKGVAHRNERGAIFSRRMVRDEQERKNNADRVRRFRGNGACHAAVTPSVTALSGDGTGKEVDVGFVSISNPIETTSQVFRRKEDQALCRKFVEADAEEIYNCYPRKIGKRAAIKAIAGALSRLLQGEKGSEQVFTSSDDVRAFLEHRTRMFAQSPSGRRGEYTPHPATWFNQSRYLDDESEWNRNGEPSYQDEKCDRCGGPKWLASQLVPGRVRECSCSS